MVETHGETLLASAEASASAARTTTLGLLAVAIVAGLALALWVARAITRPLRETVEVLQRVSDG